MSSRPELSIVIPTLNEEENLKEVLASIALQKGVVVEIIVADGGSADSTLKVAEESGQRLLLVRGKTGRASQLNAGAAASSGDYILFIHADSLFNDQMTLRRSIDALCTAALEDNGRVHAGHFALRFRKKTGTSSFGYRYLECKARLNRKGCAHGDQGILLPTELFRRYGGFEEGCQILSETRLADRLRENSQWMLLPAEISSSARRFEKEGMRERQILNAVIMALGAVGREEILGLTGLYLPQESCRKIQLQSLFRKIEQKISSFEKQELAEFWEKIGGYTCENAWQIPFGIDVMLALRAGVSQNEANYRLLGIHDRYLQPMIANGITQRLAACACRLWLKYMAWR